LWVEIQANAVEEDCCLEVLSVAEAANATPERHGFAVKPFGDSICHAVHAVVHDIPKPLIDQASHGLQ